MILFIVNYNTQTRNAFDSFFLNKIKWQHYLKKKNLKRVSSDILIFSS
jgi:hypothetical protein